jgi:type IV secretory pathway protease TraF
MFCGGFFMVIYAISHLVVYNHTISEPIGWYLKLPVGTPTKDNLYLITIPSHNLNILKKLGYHDSSNTILKKLIATSGDTVEIKTTGLFVNGHLVSDSKLDSIVRGVNLEPLPIGYIHQLKTGEYFFMGASKHSYDSRYFGVLGRGHVVNKVQFIF